MPILHMQIAGQGKDPSGKDIQVPPAIALHQRGPCIPVTVTIEQNAGKGLLAKGESLPVPRSGLCLIDTGASTTCVDDQAAQELGLPVIDVAIMTSATHAAQQCNVYPVQMTVPSGLIFNSPRTVGAALAAQGLLVLLGRDVLANCALFYNGPMGQFTLSL
jgi:predicted aspartyl protease